MTYCPFEEMTINRITKCSWVCEESMYSARLAPAILIFGLYEAFILGLRHQICQKETFLVVKLGTVGFTRNDDIGPVVATSNVQSNAIVL